jgi:hypothetical protein
MRLRLSSERRTLMIEHEQDLVSLEEIRSTLNTYAGPGHPRERPRKHGLRRFRGGLAAALAVAALAGAGVAIADGFGAFDVIGAAQHPRTGADVLDARTLAGLQNACPSETVQSFYRPECHLVLDSARLVGHVPSFGNVYVVTDTRGDFCTFFEGGDGSCGPPLSESHPITFGTFNPSPTTGGTFIASGLAADGVTAVSFTVRGRSVQVPVDKNVWVYSEPNSHATDGQCIVAHLDDGSTVNPFPGAPCP